MSKNMLLKWVEPKQTLPKERQRFGNRGLFTLILPILVEQLLTMLPIYWLAMNAINVIGNAIGIFALHAGVAGVAVPSLVSRTFAAVVMLVLCFQKKNTLYVELGKVLVWNGKMLKRILNIAVPNGVENGLFQLSKVAISSIVALFGTVQIAANGVAQSFWSMASLFCIAFGYAFVTVIGQCMGRETQRRRITII